MEDDEVHHDITSNNSVANNENDDSAILRTMFEVWMSHKATQEIRR